MNTALTERLVRFQHPEKVLGYLGGLDDDRIAALYGLDSGSYRQIRRSHDEQAHRAATELLDDPEFAGKVDRLPFAPGQRVVAVGESITDDLLSWFEILRHVLDLRRPADGIVLTNMAVSGQTTTQALTTLPGLSFQRPDWVLCMLGGNDAQRLGSADGPTLVSLAETERNLRALRDLITERTPARWVGLTPTRVDETRVRAYQPFQRAGITWVNRDIDAIGTFLNAQPDPVVDTRPVIAGQAGERFHLDDGLHLSLAGQQALTAALVDTLTDRP
ncbi:acetyl esterase/acyl-CoA thioesterase-1 [Streptosporangium subroseum]|uniref:Acetyl esterase/acyl-CoA thioesterase-1 n=1 Tax=Streptosporangium subroseum TaxID=106412 RepID=A0A239L9V4_9ACTN|nr:SGNH/GDSL hydrolase family protein [Streptosporangium subroseum]SNT27075.1 acetyl esterase/acyl-CoA thioesterase-1 [Streptosporangium subroseum]